MPRNNIDLLLLAVVSAVTSGCGEAPPEVKANFQDKAAVPRWDLLASSLHWDSAHIEPDCHLSLTSVYPSTRPFSP